MWGTAQAVKTVVYSFSLFYHEAYLTMKHCLSNINLAKCADTQQY